MSDTRLTICVSQAAERVDELLTSWTELLLVQNVACCSLEEIAQDGRDTSCMFYGSGIHELPTEMCLGDVLGHQVAGTTVTLVVFRDDGEHRSHANVPAGFSKNLFDLESTSKRCVRQLLGPSAEFRCITVGVYERPVPREAFSADWDQHLVHDRTALRLPMRVLGIESDDIAGLCAMMALCAGGGWSFSGGNVLRATHADRRIGEGMTGTVRIVRPEIRIVVSGSVDEEIAEATDDSFVQLPPWPLPSGGRVIRIPREIPVPRNNVAELARSCAFDVDSDVRYPDSERFKLQLRDALLTFRMASAIRLHFGEFVVIDDEEVADAGDVLDAIGKFRDAIGEFGRHSVTNLDSAVTALRDAEMPGLRMGMDISSRAPQPWQKIRELFFGLIDGGSLPAGVSELELPLNARPDQRPVWSDPGLLAPEPPPHIEPFKLDAQTASIVGVARVEPLDVLHCRRVDAIITHEEDPFPYLNEEDRPDLKDSICPEVRSRWKAWRSTWRFTPLGELSDMLGEAVEQAYSKFVDAMKDVGDDGYVIERYSFNWQPLIAAILLCLIGGGLVLWRILGNGGPIPTSGSGFHFAVWGCLALVLVLLGIYLRSIQKLDRFELMSIKLLEARHYAFEVTRLHGLCRAFMDHQKVVRVLLHEPFGKGDTDTSVHVAPSVDDSAEQMTRLGPPSILCGFATMSDEQREIISSLSRDDVFHSEWLRSAHDEMVEAWRQEFGYLIGSQNFKIPDDDYLPPGELPHQDLRQNKLPGTREHFRAAIVNDVKLRTAGRVRVAKELAQLTRDTVVRVEQIGSVRVESYPAFSGSASDFVRFVDSELSANKFDASVLRNIHLVPVDESCSIGSVDASRIGGDRFGQAMFVSWRMLVSDAYDAGELECVEDGEKGRSREKPEARRTERSHRRPII